MKKVFKILTTLFVLIGLTACSNATQSGASISTNPGNGGGSSNGGGSNGGGGSNLPVINVEVDNMFASKVALTSGSQNVFNRAFTNITDGKLDTITYFDGKTNKPYIFNNGGTNVLLGVTDINKISDSIIAITYDAMYPVTGYKDGAYEIGEDPNHYFREAILDLTNKTLIASYDYNLNHMQYYNGKLYGAGKNPSNDRLYEIDPTSMTGKCINDLIKVDETQDPDPKPIMDGRIYAYTDNCYFYEPNKMLVLKNEKLGFNVEDVVNEETGQELKYSIYSAPRIYEKKGDNWKVSFAGVNLTNKNSDKLNIICFLQEDINKPIYAMYSKDVSDNVYIGEVNIGVEVNDGITRPTDCNYFSWNITGEQETGIAKTIFDIKQSNDEATLNKKGVRKFKYPCFYQKQGNSNRYVQEPTKFFQSSNVRIVDYLNGGNNVFEITFVGGVPTVNNNSNISVADIPWKNYESCVTPEMISGKSDGKIYFKDEIEMVGNDVYFLSDKKIYKNNTSTCLTPDHEVIVTKKEGETPEKPFFITNNSIIYTSSDGTHNISLEGNNSDTAFADYDIGVKKFINFDKPVVIKTVGLNMNGGNKDAEDIFEKAFGEGPWETYVSDPKFNPVKFQITDNIHNMASLQVDPFLKEPALSHYEVGVDSDGNPLFKILAGEECYYFKLTYLGKFKSPKNSEPIVFPSEKAGDTDTDYVIVLQLNYEGAQVKYAFKKQQVNNTNL